MYKDTVSRSSSTGCILGSAACHGTSSNLHTLLSISAFENRVYFTFGQICAYSIVHGGKVPAFFSPLAYDVFANGVDTNLKVDISHIHEQEFKQGILQVTHVMFHLLPLPIVKLIYSKH